MNRNWWCLFALTVSLGWPMSAAEARHPHFGIGFYSQPLCVTGPYYGPFNTYYGSPFGYSVYSQLGGVYAPGYVGLGSGYGYGYGYGYGGYWGGYPSVVSTSYSPTIVINQTPAIARPRVVVADSLPAPPANQRTPTNFADALQQHSEKRENIPLPPDDATVVRNVSGSSRAGRERSKQFQAEGDRWLHEGQNVKAYLRYLEAQREAEDRGEVYFRQAFVLVAMGRYSHAVSKLKRGLQVDPKLAQHSPTLDEVFGVDNVVQKVEYLQRVADWTNADVRDPDRLFLMGVLLHFDEDSRASEFINAAWKLAGRGPHIQAFLQAPGSPPKETPAAAIAKGRALPPPPAPRDDPTVEPPAPRDVIREPQPIPPKDARGPRLPAIPVPPEPDRRQLILPDVYLPEDNK